MGKGGGDNNNQNKAKPGMNLAFNVSPDEIGNKSSMSSIFTMLAVGAAGVLVMAHVANPIKTFLFGVADGESSGGNALASAQPNQLIDALKEVAAAKPSTASWGVKELFGTMPPEQQTQMIEWIQKQKK